MQAPMFDNRHELGEVHNGKASKAQAQAYAVADLEVYQMLAASDIALNINVAMSGETYREWHEKLQKMVQHALICTALVSSCSIIVAW